MLFTLPEKIGWGGWVLIAILEWGSFFLFFQVGHLYFVITSG
jgi:hypothetical protein